MLNPYCKDCPARYPACHDYCPQFADWRKEHAKENCGRRETFTAFDRHTDHVYCCRCGHKMEGAEK